MLSPTVAVAMCERGRCSFSGTNPGGCGPAWLLVLWLLLPGCSASIPDVQPFASGTASLYGAHQTESEGIVSQYDASIDLARELQSARPAPLDSAQRETVDVIFDRLEADRDRFVEWDRAFDMTLRLAVEYSEAIAELAEAGQTGSEAAQSLGRSLNEFGAMTGLGGLIAQPISSVVEQVAEIATAVQARGSLREATLVAQPAVDTIAGLLKEIHGAHLQQLVSALAADTDQLLLYEAGSAIVGYYREANARRRLYYRRALLTLQLNDDGISGFCRDPETAEIDEQCINLQELEALREVEDRLRDLTPEIERYQAERENLRQWRNLRRANGALIAKAIDTWADAHRKTNQALADGSGVSVFSLQAILAKIDSRH